VLLGFLKNCLPQKPNVRNPRPDCCIQVKHPPTKLRFMSVSVPTVEWIPLNTQENKKPLSPPEAGIPEEIYRKGLTNRLSRIEGHVRSVKDMVGTDRPVRDIVLQVQAIKAALNQFALVLIEHELKEDLQLPESSRQQIDDLMRTLKMLLKQT